MVFGTLRAVGGLSKLAKWHQKNGIFLLKAALSQCQGLTLSTISLVIYRVSKNLELSFDLCMLTELETGAVCLVFTAIKSSISLI